MPVRAVFPFTFHLIFRRAAIYKASLLLRVTPPVLQARTSSGIAA
jgi:hypothetical protein